MTTPPTSLAPPASQDELYSIALRIREHQLAREWSLTELMRRHGGSEGLGSDKTFNKVLGRDFSEMKVEKKVGDFRAVLALLDELPTDEEHEEIYEDLSGPVKLRKALLKAMTSTSPARCVIVEGASGMGKTSALTVIRRVYGPRLVVLEATTAWDDRPNAFLVALLTALGDAAPPAGQAARLTRAVARLLEGRKCLCLEEAHHLGPRCLNVLKTLLNMTKSEAILFAIPTLLKRLEHAAYEEARQITGNRLAERVKLTKINPADVLTILTRRLPGLNGDTAKAAELLTVNAPRHGNLAFVREVVRRVIADLREAGHSSDAHVTYDDVQRAATAEIADR